MIEDQQIIRGIYRNPKHFRKQKPEENNLFNLSFS